jgi:hypothetical protein
MIIQWVPEAELSSPIHDIFIDDQLNILIEFLPRSPRWHQDCARACVCMYEYAFLIFMRFPSHCVWFVHHSNIWRSSSSCNFLHLICTSSLLGQNVLSTLSHTNNLCFSIAFTYKTNESIFLYTESLRIYREDKKIQDCIMNSRRRPSTLTFS